MKITTCASVLNPIDLKNFSTFTRVLHVVAYCLKFISSCHKKSDNNNSKKNLIPQLSVEEIEKAEIVLLKIVQGEAFSKEIRDLKANKYVHKDSCLASLHPFLDENGLVRVCLLYTSRCV